MIVGLALRQRNLPSEWENESAAAIITALRLLEETDRDDDEED